MRESAANSENKDSPVRKIDPTSVKTDFIDQVQGIRAFYAAGLDGLPNKSDQSTLSEHMLMAAAVSWEGFVSDMFIAYMNRNPSQLKIHLQKSFDEQLRNSGKPKALYDRFGKITFPTHLSKADVQSLANPAGNNITYSNYALLKEGAVRLLSPEHAEKFTKVTSRSSATVDAMISIRNHIAHRSERSGQAMNHALNAAALHSTGLKRGVNKPANVGAWLKAKAKRKAESRLEIVLTTLDSIAATF